VGKWHDYWVKMNKEQETIEVLRQELKKYIRGYEILIKYWDSISDEEKQKAHEELTKIGL
tara:strand:+ start:1035 stop:1214 length:180 start_codon:yes stop_codon:yes gene_type:complete